VPDLAPRLHVKWARQQTQRAEHNSHCSPNVVGVVLVLYGARLFAFSAGCRRRCCCCCCCPLAPAACLVLGAICKRSAWRGRLVVGCAPSASDAQSICVRPTGEWKQQQPWRAPRESVKLGNQTRTGAAAADEEGGEEELCYKDSERDYSTIANAPIRCDAAHRARAALGGRPESKCKSICKQSSARAAAAGLVAPIRSNTSPGRGCALERLSRRVGAVSPSRPIAGAHDECRAIRLVAVLVRVMLRPPNQSCKC
jgi:hypothetical protein